VAVPGLVSICHYLTITNDVLQHHHGNGDSCNGWTAGDDHKHSAQSKNCRPKQQRGRQQARWCRRNLSKRPESRSAAWLRSIGQNEMPQRLSTRYSYDQWLTNHILPHWGEGSITDVQPRPVELWLHSLTLSPKSRVHIRGRSASTLGVRYVAR
jgi:hypothetical protein